jgi:hypothetical protein
MRAVYRSATRVVRRESADTIGCANQHNHRRTTMAKRALCVGINNYPGTGSDLNGCVNDAKDWKAALQARGYSVTTLFDASATRQKVLDALQKLVGSGKKGDNLVFTFSGHGSWIPDKNGDEGDQRDEMLCPYDINKNKYLLDDDLAEVFGKKQTGVRLFFISDSCHSGTVARFAPPLFPEAALLQPRPRFLPPQVFVRDKKVRKQLATISNISGTLVPVRQTYPALLLAGCKDVEYSYDANFGGRPNGAFTYFALVALKKKPKTPRAWMKTIQASLPSSSHPQSPQIYGAAAAKDGAMP